MSDPTEYLAKAAWTELSAWFSGIAGFGVMVWRIIRQDRRQDRKEIVVDEAYAAIIKQLQEDMKESREERKKLREDVDECHENHRKCEEQNRELVRRVEKLEVK